MKNGKDADDHAVFFFERVLEEEISKWLREKDTVKGPPSQYAVADLQLAFDNDQMMSMLTSRADALKAGKFEKAKEI